MAQKNKLYKCHGKQGMTPELREKYKKAPSVTCAKSTKWKVYTRWANIVLDMHAMDGYGSPIGGWA